VSEKQDIASRLLGSGSVASLHAEQEVVAAFTGSALAGSLSLAQCVVVEVISQEISQYHGFEG